MLEIKLAGMSIRICRSGPGVRTMTRWWLCTAWESVLSFHHSCCSCSKKSVHHRHLDDRRACFRKRLVSRRWLDF